LGVGFVQTNTHAYARHWSIEQHAPDLTQIAAKRKRLPKQNKAAFRMN